jgi:putative flippase GtrA
LGRMPCGQPSNLSLHVATQSDTVTGRASAISDAAGDALRRRANWFQLAKFCVVGASGYVVNLAVFATLIHWAGMHYIPAAVCSFLVAVTNNYVWNRLWTFRGQRGHVAYQGLRFFVVSVFALGANLFVLHALIASGLGEVAGQALAVILVTPLNFVGNKLWSFRR